MKPSTDILACYGLDRALTEEDDAGLWAAALSAYWPDPSDPEAPVGGMVFAVGHVPGAPDEGDLGEHPRHGLVEIVAWRFERAAPERLRALQVMGEADDPRAPRPGEDPFGEGRYPLLFLDVERPSTGVESALVHAGRLFGALAGAGATRRWEREPFRVAGQEGTVGWREGESLHFWIS